MDDGKMPPLRSLDFGVTVLAIKMLGSLLLYCGLQPDGAEAQLAGTLLQLLQNRLTIPLSLVVRMDSHAFDLGLIVVDLERPYRHHLIVAKPHQKFAATFKINPLDMMEIIIPRTAFDKGATG